MDKITNWEEADQAIREIGELQIQISAIEGKLTERTNELKAAATAEAAPLKAKEEYTSTLLKAFCEENKAEFTAKRSKVLNFGTVAYKFVPAIIKPWPSAEKKVADLMAALKNFGLESCIRIQEVIDRKQVEELDDKTIAKLGLKRESRDSFRIEPNLERIQSP